jgi:glycerate dehydrogenase
MLVHRSFHSSGPCSNKPKTLFLNAARLDYDRQLDFSRLQALTDFVRHDTDYVRDRQLLVKMVNEHQPEVVITKEMEVPLECLLQFPDSVKLLCEAGTGYNNIPIKEARSRNIVVCNIPTYSTDAVAHMAITYMMNLSISMFRQQEMLWNGDRSNFTGPFTLPLMELNEKTLGLVGGSGLIGSKVADVALALGMKIIISSRQGSLPLNHRHANNPRVHVTSDVSYLLGNSDFVSLHTPLNDKTRGSFGREQIAQMKPTAFLINTSRGAVCREQELIDCLKEGLIQGAGLDVTVGEPPHPDSELWSLKNAWLTPHIGRWFVSLCKLFSLS